MKQNNLPHRGQIVVVKGEELINDNIYKIKASIKTGNLAGQECYVSHRNNNLDYLGHLCSREFIVRIDIPWYQSQLRLQQGIDNTAAFVAQVIPPGFEYVSSKDIVLFGVWRKWMNDGTFSADHAPIPNLEHITKFFDPGFVFKILHYTLRDNRTKPYELTPHLPPEEKTKGKHKTVTKNVALRRYLKQCRYEFGPRVVTIDEDINLSAILDLFKQNCLRSIELESQQ